MSERPQLVFERLDIRRMPGIEAGFTVDGLRPGVNVIYGPNGSGKTSLTRALATLIWRRPNHVERAILNGAFSFDGRTWHVSFDAGHFVCQADGREADFPLVDVADANNRYVLALHDLLLANDQNFAAAILRESTGGYDIGCAGSMLNYSAKPSAPAGLQGTLTKARATYREANGKQEALRQKERTRVDLLESQQSARSAMQQMQTLQRAKEYQSAGVALADALQELERFPPVLSRLTGNEPEELARLRERRVDLDNTIQHERQTILRAQKQQSETRLAEPLAPALIANLRHRCQAMREIERDLNSANQRWDEAETTVATTRDLIGPAVDDARLMAFDASQIDLLAKLMRESQQAHADVSVLRSLVEKTPSVDSGPDLATEQERLAFGIRCLTNWLRQGRTEESTEPAAGSPMMILMLAAAGLAIVEALLLGLLVQPLLLLLLVPALGLLLFGVRASSGQPSSSTNTADYWRAEYGALRLNAPASWEPRAVEAVADALAQRLRHVQMAQEWQHVHKDYPQAVAAAERIDARIAQFTQTAGIAHVRDVTALHSLATTIVDWQRARSRADAARAGRNAVVTRFEAELSALNQLLIPFGYAAVDGYPAASAVTEDLAEREDQRAAGQLDEQRSRSQLDGTVQQQLDRWQVEFNQFFARFGLVPDDEYSLTSFLDQRSDYQQAKGTADLAELELERARRNLDGAEPFVDLSPDDLNEALRLAQVESEALEDILAQIASIDAQIEQAKQGHSVEQALATEQQAADALRDAREQNERLVSGWALTEFVARQTRDVDRPRVFHRARELFARITQGRYELHIDGTDPPTFRARDTMTGTGHALDELSSGTRLQLLLAVRVAFVEQQERGPKLPLILDETLGNSDEYRARAIIDATIQIARDGRQVLYLTAQHDEVHKWSAIMDGITDVPFAVVDLAEVRGMADWERLPQVPAQSWVLPNVPSPNGHSREEYGRVLHVPGIDFSATDSGSLHLWHLIDDLTKLHDLLSIQVETWGQLRTLAQYGGQGSLSAPADIVDCCRARVQVIDVIAAAWRIGKGRPVDRAVLLESGAVTSTFIERVAELAHDLAGDGAALITALESGRISRFQTSSREGLATYLETHGYIDRSIALTIDDVRARALASANGAIGNGLLTADWVNQTLSMYWREDSA